MNTQKLVKLTSATRGWRVVPMAIVAFCMAAAMPSMAAQRNWKGNGANTYWNTSGNWDSMPGGSDSLAFRTSGVKNMTATLNGSYTYSGNIHMGNGSSAANPYVWEASNSANKLTIKDDIWFGYYEDGWLWIKSGTYEFNGTSGKKTHLGEGSGSNHNFWLKVGDGSSTVSLTTKADIYLRGGSTLVADKATLNFSAGVFGQNETSASYITNTTMSAQTFRLHGKSSATFSNSTLTVSRDLNVGNDANNTCSFRGVSSTVRQAGSSYVFNVGVNANATGIVEKDGGDWTCYYLRLGSGNGAKGTFMMDGGTLTTINEFTIGTTGTTSSNTFTLNDGTVTSSGSTYIGKASGTSGTLVLNGGTFTAKNIGSSGSGKIVLNGGTLAASAAGTFIPASVPVEVGANGGTIDTAWHNITITPGISDVSGENGTITFTGGGMVTPVGTLGCSAVTLAAGTSLAVADTNKSFIENLSVDFSANGAGDGALVITNTTANGTFSAADLAAITLTGNEGNRYALVLADGNTTIRVVDTLAGEYVWNDGASEADWTAAGKWSKGGVAGDWFNSTHAAFANSGDKATLSTDVTAVDVTFRADAEVLAGGGTLTVPAVIVSNGVAAAIAAPTAGPLTKDGAGTLTLATSRLTDETVLSEGTLAFSGTASIDWTKLTFGTDPAKPVTLRMEQNATIANRPAQWYIGNDANITSTIVKAGGDWTLDNVYVACAAGANTSFIHENGTMTISSTVDLGKVDNASHTYFEVAGGTVTHNGYIHMGSSSPATMTVKTGAKYEAPTANGYGIIVAGNASATLNVNGGEVYLLGPINMCYYGAKGPVGTVNVTDGGLVTCERIIINGKSNGGSASVTLDGGTLRANKDHTAFIPNKNNLTVTAGASGGTIDTNGKDITIAKTISGTGGMAFTGGGKARFTVAPSYTGKTVVEIGTTVYVAEQSYLASGYEVVAPETAPADGVYAIFTISGAGTFTSSALDGAVVPAGASLRLSTDSKTILCVYGNPGYVWVGGASGSLSDGVNWLPGTVPTSGDSCVIGNDTAANLTLGDTFAPSSITFSTNSALITISGERAISGLTSIVNNSLQHHVFACPIDASAATPTLPLADANYLVFSGGISLTTMPSINDMRLAGVWNLTGVWDEPPPGTSIMSGSTVNVSGLLDDGYNIVIQANATLNAAEVKAPHGDSPKNRFLYKNAGTFNVTGEMLDTIASTGSTAYSLAGAFAKGDSKAVTRTKGLVHSGSTKSNHQFILNNTEDSVTNTFVLGSGGLSFRDNLRSNSACYPYFQIDSGKAATLASSADWSFGANSVSGRDLNIELEGNGTLIVDTSDYDDRTVGHTIRAIGRIGGGGILVVKGCGTLVLERYADFARGLTIQDTATLAIKSGCTPTRSAPTVEAGATLQVAESGTAALSQNLTLKDNACLGFNFTSKTVPVLDVTGRTVTFGGQSNVVVKVSAADGIRARGGANVLTAGGKFAGANVTLAEGAPKWAKGVRVENNEIVLDVITLGTYIFVR